MREGLEADIFQKEEESCQQSVIFALIKREKVVETSVIYLRTVSPAKLVSSVHYYNFLSKCERSSGVGIRGHTIRF